MVLVNGDRKLHVVQNRLGFDLHRNKGAVLEPVDHSVDATIEHRQKDMEVPAGLCDQVRPNQKLACLTDGVLATVRPAGVQLAHRIDYERPSSRWPLPSSTFRRTGSGISNVASSSRQRFGWMNG